HRPSFPPRRSSDLTWVRPRSDYRRAASGWRIALSLPATQRPHPVGLAPCYSRCALARSRHRDGFRPSRARCYRAAPSRREQRPRHTKLRCWQSRASAGTVAKAGVRPGRDAAPSRARAPAPSWRAHPFPYLARLWSNRLIADTADGADHAGRFGIVFDFGPQPRHVYVDELGVTGMAITPDQTQQLGAAEDL